MSSYGAFTNSTDYIVAVVLGGTNLPLATTLLAQGLTNSPSTTDVQLSESGTYRLAYCVRTTAQLLASSRLTVNGSQLNGSELIPSVATDTYCRTTMATLAAGDLVRVQLYGLLGAAALLSGPGGVELILERLAP
ncbi:MAG: hypothetical protein R2708_08790 [Vicinamibacterales bacterium]